MLARGAIKVSIILAGVALATTARAECSRETLRKLTDTYVKAQSAGKPANPAVVRRRGGRTSC